MKGLLARLPAADPLDPECVFTINPPLCLQQATSSSTPPPSSLPPHPPLPSHTNGHIYRERAPTLPSQHPLPASRETSPPSVHRSCTHPHTLHTLRSLICAQHTCTRSHVTRCTCRTTQIRSASVHVPCSKAAMFSLQKVLMHVHAHKYTHLHANMDNLSWWSLCICFMDS